MDRSASAERALAECDTGAKGRICSVLCGHTDNRLKALGFCPGHRFHVARSGNPMVVDICHTRVAIEKSIADNIRVIECPEIDHA